MEEDTFCSISRSFFRLVLDSAWMPSRLILKAPEGPLISRKLPCSLARTAGPLGGSPSGTVAPDTAHWLPEARQTSRVGRAVWGQTLTWEGAGLVVSEQWP